MSSPLYTFPKIHLILKKSNGMLRTLHDSRAQWQMKSVFKPTHSAWVGMGFKVVSFNLLAIGKNKLIHISPSFMPNPFHSQLCQSMLQILYPLTLIWVTQIQVTAYMKLNMKDTWYLISILSSSIVQHSIEHIV